MTPFTLLNTWKESDNSYLSDFALQTLAFVQTSDPVNDPLPTAGYVTYAKELGKALAQSETWEKGETLLVILAWRSARVHDNSLNVFCGSFFEALENSDSSQRFDQVEKAFQIAADFGLTDDQYLSRFSHCKPNISWEFGKANDQDFAFSSPFATYLWKLTDSQLAQISTTQNEPQLGFFAEHRSGVLKEWFKKKKSYPNKETLQAIARGSASFDSEIIELVNAIDRPILKNNLCFPVFHTLYSLRPDQNRAVFHDLLRDLKIKITEIEAESIVSELPDEALKIFRNLISADLIHAYHEGGHRIIFGLASEHLDHGGLALLEDLANHGSRKLQSSFLRKNNEFLSTDQSAISSQLLQTMIPHRKNEDLDAYLFFLKEVVSDTSLPIHKQLEDLLENSSKKIRQLAIDTLISIDRYDLLATGGNLLISKKADNRITASLLLAESGPQAIPLLQKAHFAEKSQKVQAAIEQALSKLGNASPVIAEAPAGDLLAQIESDKRIKLPTAPWFDLSKFPLIQKDGTSLSEKVVTFLIQKQSKHKTIDAAPGILPVLELLDREQNSDSALALLNQWLDSDQVAKDRWALVLAGLLGDNRIIPALTPRIQPWCENARHKLAEYAAQAISLLATEEALMILDTLANRYRSKFKNIGKACNAAFLAAAEARGVTPDELGDLVVPDLGFNSECHKEFDDGKIIAVLQPDFKITWLNPETEKETKSPPSNLSDAGKEELKTLRKILREAVKGQTARLEQMLVRQRRWPVARWQELFEEHPLLQSYAASLVWGIYDSNSELLRTFRRYPNGILAHGSGEMEDLEERDTQIGLVHPLELDAETLGIWLDHLGRFKVKPPFPQLDRPVEVLKDDHGNRREITFTENVQISGGTFLSRMNKRGWIRGSVIDGGGVTCYYKPFEGAGAEAILFLEEYWVGFDPVDSFPLGKGLFATLSTVDRGSYIYDDPQPTDPRVLPFGEVPPIVYSEVIADLKALIEGQSKP